MSVLALGDKVQVVKQRLVDFIRHQCAEAGYMRAVIGLSGGVDSAVIAYLCAEALGAKNVYGIRLPCDEISNSHTSMQYARLVIEKLGIWYDTIDLSPMAMNYFVLGRDGIETDRLRRGNFVARLRMAVLYDLSKAHDALVIGTGNKTEWLLGYCTLHGDSAAAMHPILDLYKTQVWELARYLGVPDAIIDRPPSADLWDGQTDEVELGWSYEEMDKALGLLLNNDGVSLRTNTVEAAVFELMSASQFKRKSVPFCEVQNEL